MDSVLSIYTATSPLGDTGALCCSGSGSWAVLAPHPARDNMHSKPTSSLKTIPMSSSLLKHSKNSQGLIPDCLKLLRKHLRELLLSLQQFFLSSLFLTAQVKHTVSLIIHHALDRIRKAVITGSYLLYLGLKLVIHILNRIQRHLNAGGNHINLVAVLGGILHMGEQFVRGTVFLNQLFKAVIYHFLKIISYADYGA